jgi:hypothetical protein
MEPILTPIMIILGKYALDKGIELGKAVGPDAFKTAKEIYGMTLDYLRKKDTEGQVFADRFEKTPDKYSEEIEEMLAASLEADPDFAAKLEALLAQYKQQAQEHAATTGTTYEATIGEGTGAIAQGEGASAATATGGGIAIGSAGGDVNIGDVKRDKKK